MVEKQRTDADQYAAEVAYYIERLPPDQQQAALALLRLLVANNGSKKENAYAD